MTQTVTQGVPVAQNYGQFGFANRWMIPPPSSLLGLCVGRSNTGKTSLFLSHPGSLVINCDLSSTPMAAGVTTPPPGQMWPGINDNGQYINIEGKPFVPSAKDIFELKEKLIAAAKANQPRPQMVVIDGIASFITLLKDWVVDKMGKKSWDEVHGQQGWGLIYDTVVEFGRDLRAAGYGVWYIAHLIDKVIPIEEDKNTLRIDINMSDKLYARIYGLFEIVMGVEKRKVLVPEKVEQIINTSKGPQTITKEVVSEVEKRILTVKNDALERVLKLRIQMPPEMELPPTGGWKVFEDAYRKAVLPVSKDA